MEQLNNWQNSMKRHYIFAIYNADAAGSVMATFRNPSDNSVPLAVVIELDFPEEGGRTFCFVGSERLVPGRASYQRCLLEPSKLT